MQNNSCGAGPASTALFIFAKSLHLQNKFGIVSVFTKQKETKMALDTIDVKILEVLQDNARVSISELSKQVNLSLSAVSERLKKLENSNIIEQYTTVLNPSAMEKDLSAIMMISMEDPSDTDEFRRMVQEQDEILECHYITGTYDYVLKITTKNMSTLEQLMNKIKSINSIKHTETNVIFSTIKNKHSVMPIATKL